MTEQELKAVEQSLEKIEETIRELTTEKAQLEMQISNLVNVKSVLTRLLPPDKRIAKLFD
jgi:chaperonin cofactor prefoldin